MSGGSNSLSAMVLAAGHGRRMGALTSQIPKPLIKVSNKALIDYTLDDLAAAGVKNVVVNIHAHAELLQAHLEQRINDRLKPAIRISHEKNKLLDTGGALVRAMPLLSSNPFFIANSDVVRLDYGKHACKILHETWNPDIMDFLLLVHRKKTAIGFVGKGDFYLSTGSKLTRRGSKLFAPYIYAGLCLCSPGQFTDIGEEVFSLNVLWNRACAKGRLLGVEHDGKWLHVGSLEGLKSAEATLRDG